MTAVLVPIIGLMGVLAGAFLSQGLAASRQHRKERLEALVAVVAASARVIGAHERLYELFSDGSSPQVDSEPAQRAFTERVEAHAQWRTAQARVEILIPESRSLKAAIDSFGRNRASATNWVLEYQRLGSGFLLADHAESQRESWVGMRRARYDLISAGQGISLRDAGWFGGIRTGLRVQAAGSDRSMDA